MAINLFLSDYEPTDEELEEIMAAAAREAEKGDKEAHKKLFEEIEMEMQMQRTNIDSLSYKGYIGTVDYSEMDSIYFGKIEGIEDLVNYEGKNLSELTEAFHEAVDDYIGETKTIHSELSINTTRLGKIMTSHQITRR